MQKHPAPDQLCLRIRALTFQGRLAVGRLAPPIPCPIRRGQQRRWLANVRDDKTLPAVWFTGNVPKRSHERPPYIGKDDPPDERTLKLGNGMFASPKPGTLRRIANTKCLSSCPPTSRTPPDPLGFSTTTGNPIPADIATLVPIYSSSFASSLRQNILHRRIMDSASRVGQSPRCRQCQTHRPLRADGEERTYVAIISTRKAYCEMEDVRQNERQGHGRALSRHWRER